MVLDGYEADLQALEDGINKIIPPQVDTAGLMWGRLNLLDRKLNDIEYFYTSRLQGEPASGVSDVHFHPLERRAFRATVSLGF